MSADGPKAAPPGAFPDAAELSEERALCERAQAGDRPALGQVLRRHGPRLYRAVLLPRLGSIAAAEEALSTTYLKVVENFHKFRWQAFGVYPWLRSVALHVVLDQLRRYHRKRESFFSPDDLEREIGLAERQHQDRTAAELEAEDLSVGRERVLEVLKRLHPRYAQAITLRILEERPREECAVALKASPATFDVVLHRAIAALKKELAREPS